MLFGLSMASDNAANEKVNATSRFIQEFSFAEDACVSVMRANREPVNILTSSWMSLAGRRLREFATSSCSPQRCDS
jgi:hypothetical protein